MSVTRSWLALDETREAGNIALLYLLRSVYCSSRCFLECRRENHPEKCLRSQTVLVCMFCLSVCLMSTWIFSGQPGVQQNDQDLEAEATVEVKPGRNLVL